MFLVALVSSSLVIANIIASKIVNFSLPLFGELTASAGVIPISIAFLCTDILNERWGEDVAKKAVWTSVSIVALSWGMIQMAVWLPHSSGVPQEMFATTLSSSTPIFVASITTVLVSQTFDVTLFNRIKSITGVGHKWVRNIGSTATSQLLDTSLFTMLAFMVFPLVVGGVQLSAGVVVSIIAVEYVVKIILALIDTPFFYILTNNNQVEEI